MYARKQLNHCTDETCLYCALHCPYCGEEALLLDWDEARRMRCPRCGHGEDLPYPTMMAVRNRQALAISGYDIRHWKAKARQLSARFHYRWRSTLFYLDPASSAAMSHGDDWWIVHAQHVAFDDELILLRGKAARRVFQRLLNADPALSRIGVQAVAFLDDWF